MSTWDERMTPRSIVPPPLERVATLFRVLGITRRPLRCALYSVATGLELRLEYEDRADDIQHSQLFRVRDDDAIEGTEVSWEDIRSTVAQKAGDRLAEYLRGSK